MLSLVIPTNNDEDRLAHMLPALVPHAVSGAVSEVAVYDDNSQDQTLRVAEIAGCAVSNAQETPVPAFVDNLRGHWLLLLEPGARLAPGWFDAVEEHAVRVGGGSGAARFRLARDPAHPWWAWALPQAGSKRPFLRGFLISKRQASALARPGMALADLPRGVAVRTLRAAIIAPRAKSASGSL